MCKMKKIGKVILCSVLAASLVVSPVLAEEDIENIDVLQEQKDNAQAEVDQLEAELTAIIEELNSLEIALIEKGMEIEQAKADLDQAEALKKMQLSAMRLRIKFMYESGKASLVNAVLAAESMSDALNKAEYASEISKYDRRMIDNYAQTAAQIKALKATLEEEQNELLALQDQYQARQEELNVLIETKRTEVADFDERLQAAIAAAEEKARREEEARLAEEARQQALAQQALALAEPSYNDYSEPASSYCGYNPGTGNAIVDAAYTQLGVPYVWGGSTPYVALDCSGLVQYCYACAGISIPRTSAAMAASGCVVYDPQPGDICWTPGHVAIYIGGGQMIEAQQSGVPVKISAERTSMYLRF